ncbi:MAG: Aspartate-semialdehyde dehydrogenase Acd [Candidatus Methanohalarchaeum thermophilum]|uniref:Aspartate-semialdehyde dehydrogenase Acd n=1 Tax=Methanohalarchaeum thermophilum TaxID=1903181 RepID=A0A1Q6DTM3_METT1|nr:MAG: Aspartate-semialdehyde dehydrogenase Acd [Candidatus Methanohalarchaeum thermophilum]
MNIDVGVLGSTGMVGQRFVSLLSDHPWFNIESLAASEKSAGHNYKDAVDWVLDTEIPSKVQGLEVQETKPGLNADIIFSALPSDVANSVEPEFAEAGYFLASNASSYRMETDVPLVIPEVNPDHIELIDIQKRQRDWDGAIVTNPNCSTIILTIPIDAIRKKFDINEIKVSTLQAVSGAGYTGVPSMAIIDNAIPYIGGEEEKMENETKKLLGKIEEGKVKRSNIEFSAQCNRIPTVDGHLENVWIDLEEEIDSTDIKEVLRDYSSVPQDLGLPTAPSNPIKVSNQSDRPQPRLDRDEGEGMTISVGRVRGKKEIKMVTLGHNTVRGAAGASILNAELLAKKGYL